MLGKTWKVVHTYTDINGLLWTDAYGAGGGLPAETVTHTYNNDGQPYGLATTSYGYVQGTTYTAQGQVAQVQLGSSTSFATVSDTYDPNSGNLTDQLVTRSTTTPASIDETSYSYDLSGNITQQTETRLGSSTDAETQCYDYDTLDRLTAAWTATDACAATPTTSAHTTVGDGISGGEYWTSWTYDALGNRQSQDRHALTTGATDTDTTSSYSTSQPNTVTGTTTTGGATGSTGYGYDPAGNTITRDTSTGDEKLTWNNAGQLTTVADNVAGTSSNYIYDADGNLLLQIDPTSTTLYLGSEQITLTGTTATGVRYYAAPGGATIVRTGAGTDYDFELSDQHGTSDVYLDSTAQIPTWRQFDPFGNARGTTTTWVDNRTFLNKTTDPTTGLTDMGARYYDSTLGRFISLDPLFEATDSQELNGYTYGASNPVTNSDPSGEMVNDGGQTGSVQAVEETDAQEAANAKAWEGKVTKEARQGDYYSPWSGNFVSTSVLNTQAKEQYQAEQEAEAQAKAARSSWWSDFEDVAEQAAPIVADVVVDSALEVATDGAATPALAEIDEAMDGGIEGAETVSDATTDAATDAPRPGCMSFAPTTLVLMAGGKTKPIAKIKPGDKVQAANPNTGKDTSAETVTATWLNDDHDLLNLTITTPDGHQATIHTTSNHPFWDDTTHTWVTAGKLTPGQHLITAADTDVTVTTATPTPGTAYRNNLTVDQLHTYYVLAGQTPILVHNCASPNIRISPAASDWATKGAHMHVGSSEIRVFPTGDGGVGFEGIRLSNGMASARDVETARSAIMNNPELRADLIDKARSAMSDMNDHNWGNSLNRAPEMNFLIKALGKIE